MIRRREHTGSMPIRTLIAMSIGAMALTVAGCSQISAYAPVSGGPQATVEVAVGDVLAASAVPVLVRPECRRVEAGFACTGSTLDGTPIAATATGSAPFMLRITVGDAVIFDGEAQRAIDASMRVEQ